MLVELFFRKTKVQLAKVKKYNKTKRFVKDNKELSFLERNLIDRDIYINK